MTLGLVVFGAYLLPTLQIAGDFTGGKIFDRYLDVPLLGIIIIGLVVLYYLVEYWRKSRWILLGLVVVVGIGLGMVTTYYIPTWKTNIASTEHRYYTYPKTDSTIYNYVLSLIQYKELDKAENFVLTEMGALKSTWLKDYFLGSISYYREEYGAAYNLLFTASVKATKAGDYPLSNIYLARILVGKGDFSGARGILNELLAHPKNSPGGTFQAREILKDIVKLEKLKE